MIMKRKSSEHFDFAGTHKTVGNGGQLSGSNGQSSDSEFKKPLAKVRLSDMQSSQAAKERRHKLMLKMSTVERESDILDKMLKDKANYDLMKSQGFRSDYTSFVNFIEYRNLVYSNQQQQQQVKTPQVNGRKSPVALDSSAPLSLFNEVEKRFTTPVKSASKAPLHDIYSATSTPKQSLKTTPLADRTLTPSSSMYSWSSRRNDRDSPMSISSSSSQLSVRTVYPPPSKTLAKEQEWLQKLRQKIEEAVSISVSSNDIIAKIETPTFDRLQKDLDDRIHGRVKPTAPTKDNFPPLTKQMMAVVQSSLKSSKSPIISKFNIDIGSQDIRRLQNGQWLNDEIINFYGKLIMERAENGKQYPNVHIFNTFFYSNLKKSGYSSVKRWTRRFDLFEKDLIIFPVHLGVHWCCGVVDVKSKRIEYYDSLHGLDRPFFEVMRDYLKQESLDKKKVELDLANWEDYAPKNIPAQENGYDCGVFTCTFAEYRSRLEPFDFSQEHMIYLRNRMIYEISTGTLLTS